MVKAEGGEGEEEGERGREARGGAVEGGVRGVREEAHLGNGSQLQGQTRRGGRSRARYCAPTCYLPYPRLWPIKVSPCLHLHFHPHFFGEGKKENM